MTSSYVWSVAFSGSSVCPHLQTSPKDESESSPRRMDSSPGQCDLGAGGFLRPAAPCGPRSPWHCTPGAGSRAQGPGCRVQGAGSGAQGPGGRAWDAGSGMQGPGGRSGRQIQKAGSGMQGLGCRARGAGSGVHGPGGRSGRQGPRRRVWGAGSGAQGLRCRAQDWGAGQTLGCPDAPLRPHSGFTSQAQHAGPIPTEQPGATPGFASSVRASCQGVLPRDLDTLGSARMLSAQAQRKRPSPPSPVTRPGSPLRGSLPPLPGVPRALAVACNMPLLSTALEDRRTDPLGFASGHEVRAGGPGLAGACRQSLRSRSPVACPDPDCELCRPSLSPPHFFLN